MSATNYARNEAHDYVLFSGTVPRKIPSSKVGEWAFYQVPMGEKKTEFMGKLIGEYPESRCHRLKHAPKSPACEHCRGMVGK